MSAREQAVNVPENFNKTYMFADTSTTMNKSRLFRRWSGLLQNVTISKGKYYIFALMSLGVWVFEDMKVWENHRLPKELPLYDYAPDVRVDENVQTWWRSASSNPGEWLQVDLGDEKEVWGIQVNFADDCMEMPIPGMLGGDQKDRYIEEKDYVTRWKLEGSTDGVNYETIADKSLANTDLPHDFIELEEGKRFRYLKVTIVEVPYGQPACISGFRVFGIGTGEKAAPPKFKATRVGDLDMVVEIEPQKDAVGYNVLWGSSAGKLYHSYLIFGEKQKIGALVKGKEYFVRVDAFNEVGITEGNVQKVTE